MRTGFISNIIFCATFVFAMPAAYSQQTADSILKPMQEVVVTAQRSAQKVLNTPYSVQKLNSSQLNEFMPRSTPEALVRMNGVFLQKTNHGGGSPFLRGLTGNQTLLLVDGIRLNNSTFRYGPNQYLNTIDAFTIQDIEVAKGTGSVQYGTDAIGGVVQVLTRSPQFANEKPAFGGAVTAKYMSGDMEKTIRGEAFYSGRSFALSAGISKKDFGDLIGGDTTGKQSPSGYDEWAFDIKAKWKLSEKMQLTAATQFLQQQHVPVYHKVRLENFAINEMEPQQRLLSYARLQKKGSSRIFKETEITFSYQQNIEGRNSLKNGSTALRKERDAINTAGFTVDILSAIRKNWTANSGIELYHDKVSSTRNDINTQTAQSISKRGLYPDASRYGNYSVYSLHHFQLGKWVADAGLRFNTFSIRISDTSLGNVQISPSALVGNAGVLYKLDKRQSVYASISSGYRAPNVDDMGTLGIVDFRYEIPAAGLQPEKSTHTEIGYKLQTKKITATAALYYMHLSNLITRVKLEGRVISGYPVYKKENTEAALIKGFETEINYTPVKKLNITGGIAYAYGQSLSKNEPLRRIPPFNGRLITNYKTGNWFAAAEIQFASKQNRLAQGDKDDNRIAAGGTPGWQILNFYGGYKFRSLQLNTGLQNILNKDYRTHGSGINGVGRSAWITATIRL
jgi:hemoglobin/transferrin/lactoferrin receptor protein